MKLDAALLTREPAEAAQEARRLEALGYDGLFTFEGPHDPFLPLVLAAEHTERIELATAIAVAFARNPMTVAYLAHDLQSLSKGRFRLGLGSQIRAHVERRFSSPWSRPAARMREFVVALRAIWACWNRGEKLAFRGEFYTHTLMTPFFNPGPSPYGEPPVLVAGFGPRMTEVAGEVGDGFLVHPLHSPRSLRELTLPALERGLARSGRRRDDFEITLQLMVVTGATPGERQEAERAIRAQIAFYGSTPAYRGVLDLHGRSNLHEELHRLSLRGEWEEMAKRIDDELLEAVAVCAPPERLAGRVRERCAGVADRLSLVAPYRADPEMWREVIAELRRPAGAREH